MHAGREAHRAAEVYTEYIYRIYRRDQASQREGIRKELTASSWRRTRRWSEKSKQGAGGGGSSRGGNALGEAWRPESELPSREARTSGGQERGRVHTGGLRKGLKRLPAELKIPVAAEGLKGWWVWRSRQLLGGSHTVKAKNGEGLTQEAAKRIERRQL